MFSGEYNIRKLEQLPYHLIHSQDVEKLKEGALCNLDFLLAKLEGTSVAEVLQDFNMALEMNKDDDELKLISNTVKIGVPALRENHYNIINELIGRLKESTAGMKNLEKLVKDAEKMSTTIDSLPLVPYNQCLAPPGGALISQLLGHSGNFHYNPNHEAVPNNFHGYF